MAVNCVNGTNSAVLLWYFPVRKTSGRGFQIPFSSWKNRNIVPRANEALRIAEALNVSIEYLLTGNDRAGKPSNPAVNEITKTIPFFDETDLQTLLAAVRAMAERYK